MWLGFCWVEAPPSPKLQDQEVMVALPFVDRSVKLTESGAPPLVGVPEKSAVGAAGVGATETKSVFVALPGPAELPAVRDTLYVPGAVYVWLGLCAVEVPPSPKVQDHEVMAAPPFVHWSVN